MSSLIIFYFKALRLLLFLYYRTYRQKECLDLCKQKQVIAECKCYDLRYLNLIKDMRPCLNWTDYECLYKAQTAHFNLKQCISEWCPLECDSVEYDVSISTLENPSKIIYDQWSRNNKNCWGYDLENEIKQTYEECKRLYLTLNVYYPSLKYTKITEKPKMTLIDLLAQTGGSFSVFIGLSVFSLIEIFECLVLAIYASIF